MKYIKFIILILLISLLPSCTFNDPKYLNLKEKPNIYYYSNEVYKNLKKDKKFTLKVFDVNYYQEYIVSPEDYDILLSFLESLNMDNYNNDIDISEKTIAYKLIVEFEDSKYLFNAYDNNTVTLFPWDGNLEEDMITMTDVSEHNNIYSFCLYVINKSHKNSQ